MAQRVKLALSTLQGMLGWHGSFLLLLIVSFKLFLEQTAQAEKTFGPVCPCTWNVGYGTLMFFFPSLVIYMIAFFAYFRQDNDNVPWKAMKKLYELKRACNFYNRRTDWDLHAEHCIRCQQLKADWTLVKIAVSAIFSLLYPLLWLSLSFLQSYYYLCAQVGPPSSMLTTFCDVKDDDVPPNYDKDYFLAGLRSKVIGGVLFVSTLLFLGVLVIVCGEIESYLKKVDPSRSGSRRADNLQVHISVPPGRSSETLESARFQGNGDPSSSANAGETIEAGGQQQVVGGNKSIHINLSDEFATALKGCFQDSAWQGIDIRCSQQEESSHLQGSYAPVRPQYPVESLHQRIQPEQSGDSVGDSVHQDTDDFDEDTAEFYGNV